MLFHAEAADVDRPPPPVSLARCASPDLARVGRRLIELADDPSVNWSSACSAWRSRPCRRINDELERPSGINVDRLWRHLQALYDKIDAAIADERTRKQQQRAAGAARCTNPRDKNWKYYGGRGVMVCDRWRNSFEAFLADMGEASPGLTLDRWPNNDGNYEPGNCCWATRSEQNRNKRHGPRTAEAIAKMVATRRVNRLAAAVAGRPYGPRPRKAA